MMGISFLVSWSEQQRGGIKKSLDWLLLGSEGNLCEQDADTQGDVAVFARVVGFFWVFYGGQFLCSHQ